MSNSANLPSVGLCCFSPDGAGDVVWCDACEARHYHGGDGAAEAALPSHCHDGPRSPYQSSYSSMRIGRVDAVDGFAPVVEFKRPYWRRLRDRAETLQAIYAAVVLGLARQRVSFDVMRVAGEEIRLQRHAWQAIGPTSMVHGADLLALAKHVHRLAPPFSGEGLRPGMAAARLLEEATGARFDAAAFLGIVDVVDDFYRRGAPYGEGRRA